MIKYGAAIVAASVFTTVAATGSTASRPRWSATAWNLRQLAGVGTTLPNAFAISTKPSSLPTLADSSQVPVLSYCSFAQFRSDVAAGLVNSGYRWALYDNEMWSATPLVEQRNPWLYMKKFGQLAHSLGMRVILAPARDLAKVPGTLHPRVSGETFDHWYIRVGIAKLAAYADLFQVQTEMEEQNPTVFAHFTNAAKRQALSANPYVTIYAEVATNEGTARQMVVAARSVVVSGIYVAVPDRNISKARQFIVAMSS